MATVATHRPLASGRAEGRARAIVKTLREAPLIAVVLLGTLVFVAIFADVLAPYDPTLPIQGADIYAPPFWMDGGKTTALLGTDFQGRDTLSRLIYGTRVSLIVGINLVVDVLYAVIDPRIRLTR